MLSGITFNTSHRVYNRKASWNFVLFTHELNLSSMFRLVQQQTQVLKTRVPNQFVSASRNSLNSQLRFNSAVALDRTQSQENSSTASNSGNGSNSKYEKSETIERNVKKVRNLRRNIKFDTFKTSADSPYFAKTNACLLYTSRCV